MKADHGGDGSLDLVYATLWLFCTSRKQVPPVLPLERIRQIVLQTCEVLNNVKGQQWQKFPYTQYCYAVMNVLFHNHHIFGVGGGISNI